jgi:hypothetical protein
MIVRLADIRKLLRTMTFDRLGFARIEDEADRTRLAIFAGRANAVVEWALADYLARGCPHATPAEAKLGLALFNVVPEAFPFEDCACVMPEGMRCRHAEAWRAQLLRAAVTA